MNKLFLSFIFVFIATFLVHADSAFAATINIKEVKTTEKVDLFEIEMQKISATNKPGETNFYFAPAKVQDNSKIAKWRVRFYCDKDMAIKYNDGSKSMCGRSVKFNNTESFPGMFTFENKNQQNKKFSFALKAYGPNGKWIHTERQNFSWK